MSDEIVSGFPIPTDLPQTWAAILMLLNTLETTTLNLSDASLTTGAQLVEYLENSENLYPLTTQGGDIIAYTRAAIDSIESAQIIPEVVTGISTIAETGVVSTVTIGDGRTIGLIPKVIACGVALSLMVSSIAPAVLTDDTIQNFLDGAENYTFNGNYVPFLVNSSGESFLNKNFVESVRDVAIQAGIFNPVQYNRPANWSDEFPDYVLTSAVYPYAEPVTWYGQTAGQSTVDVYKIYRLTSTDPVYFVYINSSNSIGGLHDELYGYAVSRSTFTMRISENGNVLSTSFIATGYNYNPYGGSGSTFYYRALPYFYGSVQPNAPTYAENVDTITDMLAQVMYTIENGSQSQGVTGITTDSATRQLLLDTTNPLKTIFSLESDTVLSTKSTDATPNQTSEWLKLGIQTKNFFTDGLTESEREITLNGEIDTTTTELTPYINYATKIIVSEDPEIDFDSDVELPEIDPTSTGDTPDIPEPTPQDSDDPTPTPSVEPTILSGVSNGLWCMYAPSIQTVKDFGAWLWSSSLLDQIKRVFTNPIDAVIGFHMIYCDVTKGANQTIKAGYLDSSISSPTVANQYSTINCGAISVPEYYGNVLDYDNSRVSLYLPFIGIVQLDTRIVVGATLKLTYNVDVVTGTCLAILNVIKENSNASMYTYQGNCAVQIPLTATTYTGMVGALMSGLTAGVSLATGNIIGAAHAGAGALMSAASGAGVVQSGTLGANAGVLGIRKPYLIITHVYSAMPAGYKNYIGNPTFTVSRIGSFSGFTRIQKAHLSISRATESELDEIENMLANGIIV